MERSSNLYIRLWLRGSTRVFGSFQTSLGAHWVDKIQRTLGVWSQLHRTGTVGQAPTSNIPAVWSNIINNLKNYFSLLHVKSIASYKIWRSTLKKIWTKFTFDLKFGQGNRRGEFWRLEKLDGVGRRKDWSTTITIFNKKQFKIFKTTGGSKTNFIKRQNLDSI